MLSTTRWLVHNNTSSLLSSWNIYKNLHQLKLKNKCSILWIVVEKKNTQGSYKYVKTVLRTVSEVMFLVTCHLCKTELVYLQINYCKSFISSPLTRQDMRAMTSLSSQFGDSGTTAAQRWRILTTNCCSTLRSGRHFIYVNTLGSD